MEQALQEADDLDVENFFNQENLDNAALNADILTENAILQATSLTSAPAQAEHLINLATNGCANQLAWSRPGNIARIIEQGTVIEITVLRFDPKTSQWASKTWNLDDTFEDAVGLAWSVTGVELTVLERKGKVHIFVLKQTSATGFSLFRDGSSDSEEEFNRPIGILCASQARGDKDKKKTVLEVTKTNGKWKPEFVEGTAHPPYSVRAVCTVSKRGSFHLFFVRETGLYKTASLNLPVPPTSIFTHAALSQTPEGKMIVALHAESGAISTYYVNITLLQNEPLPTLSFEVIDVDIPATPPYFNVENHSALTGYDRWLITHLHIIPESEYSWDQLAHLPTKQPATLLAVYVSYDDQANAAAGTMLGGCVVKRWKFEKSQLELHSRFGGGTAPDSSETVSLVPLPDTQLPAPITNLQSLEPGNTLSITTLDGTTTLWDADRMTQIMGDMDSQIVSSVGQVNIDFPTVLMSTMQCVSPHGMVLANDNIEEKLVITKPKYRDISASSRNSLRVLDISNPLDEKLIAGYVLCFSRSCWMSSSFDDILASIHATVTTSSFHQIRRMMYLTLFQPKTIIPQGQTSELDRTPQSPIVQKVIAFNLGLFKLHDSKTTRHEKLAYLWSWLLLNLRWSIAILAEMYKHLQPNPNAPRPPPPTTAFIDTVCANIRWTWSLFTFIFDSILSVGERSIHPDFFHPPSFATLLGDENGDGTQGLVSLLLNCNWTRTFFLYIARMMKTFTSKAGVNINFANKTTPISIPTNSPFGKIANTIQNCIMRHGITITALEAVFDHKLYPDTWKDDVSNQATTERQVEMMVTGVVGDAYQSSIQKILANVINGPDGLRDRGELERLRIMEEAPSRSYLFLNMDDIAFRYHKPVVTSIGEILPVGLDKMNALIESESAGEGQSSNGSEPQEKRPSKRDRRHLPERVLYDTHRKVPIFSGGISVGGGANGQVAGAAGSTPGATDRQLVTNVEELLAAKVRRCVRCGSVSDEESGYQRTWPRLSIQLVAKCVCEGAYVLEEVGEGLCLGD